MRTLQTLHQNSPQANYRDLAYDYTQQILDTFDFENSEKNYCDILTGVLSTYAIAQQENDQGKLNYLRPILEKNLENMKKFQVNKRSTGSVTRNDFPIKISLPNPEKAEGGFLKSLETNQQTLTIDATQKCLEAFILAEKYL